MATAMHAHARVVSCDRKTALVGTAALVPIVATKGQAIALDPPSGLGRSTIGIALCISIKGTLTIRPAGRARRGLGGAVGHTSRATAHVTAHATAHATAREKG